MEEVRDQNHETRASDPEGALAKEKDLRVVSTVSRCPFCHVPVDLAAQEWVACESCLARHHASCWRDHGSCSTCGSTKQIAPAPVRSRAPMTAVVAGLTVVLLFSALGFVALDLTTEVARLRMKSDALDARLKKIEVSTDLLFTNAGSAAPSTNRTGSGVTGSLFVSTPTSDKAIPPGILGETREEVIARLGAPAEEETTARGSTRLIYRKPAAEVLVSDEKVKFAGFYLAGWSHLTLKVGSNLKTIYDELGPPEKDLVDARGVHYLEYERFGLLIPLDGPDGTSSAFYFSNTKHFRSNADGTIDFVKPQ
jgi:hypothetical protein